MKKTHALPRVLIVDESRMARAALIKSIRGIYDFREEPDGEAAWQVLVLDQSIEAVICALSLPILSGNELLTRVRNSRLPRLAKMPMMMIMGDDEKAVEEAKKSGASSFIQRTADRNELLEGVHQLLQPAPGKSDHHAEQEIISPDTGVFTKTHIQALTEQIIENEKKNNTEVSIFTVEFDHIPKLKQTLGESHFKQLMQRLVSILSGKTRREDSLGHYTDTQLVIVAPAMPYHACESHGNRIRKSVMESNIIIDGKPLNLSASIGVSNTVVDQALSAKKLLDLAGKRLEEAQALGGNIVMTSHSLLSSETPFSTLDRALALVKSGREEEIIPYLPALATNLLPLLELMQKNLETGLSVRQIKDRTSI